jgi:hypothetical protein
LTTNGPNAIVHVTLCDCAVIGAIIWSIRTFQRERRHWLSGANKGHFSFFVDEFRKELEFEFQAHGPALEQLAKANMRPSAKLEEAE